MLPAKTHSSIASCLRRCGCLTTLLCFFLLYCYNLALFSLNMYNHARQQTQSTIYLPNLSPVVEGNPQVQLTKSAYKYKTRSFICCDKVIFIMLDPQVKHISAETRERNLSSAATLSASALVRPAFHFIMSPIAQLAQYLQW